MRTKFEILTPAVHQDISIKSKSTEFSHGRHVIFLSTKILPG